jgi:hypothetical protein
MSAAKRSAVPHLIIIGLFACLPAFAWQKPGFPRLGGYQIGSPHNYGDSSYQSRMAQLDLIILTNYPGWESAQRTTMSQVVRSIKSKNPNALVFTYLVNNEAPSSTSIAWKALQDTLYRERWWLYPQGTSGTPVASPWPGMYMTNYTLTGRVNASGQRFVDWFPRWIHGQLFAATPEMDGAYTDNFFWKPRAGGDWNIDGTNDGKGTATFTPHRQGMRRHVQVLRSLMPTKYQLGNLAELGHPSAVFPEYEQLLNGGLIETIIGKPYSPEGLDVQGNLNSWGSWQTMMTWYRKVMRAVAEPKLVIFQQLGDPTDYQNFRYGFASCLMDDGYFSYASTSKAFASVTLFDEYEAELGNATSAPPTVAWKSGVYRRNFENGIVLVNPRGNGSVTVDLEKDFRRISGSQDPQVNNGQLTRRVTLRDRDGIVLLNTNPVLRPEAPTEVSVE